MKDITNGSEACKIAHHGGSSSIGMGTQDVHLSLTQQAVSSVPLIGMALRWHNSLIPQELRDKLNWAVFELTWNEQKGKYDKVPTNWRGRARCDDPATWRTWDEILMIVSKKTEKWNPEYDEQIVDGAKKSFAPAFALSEDDGMFCVDLDHIYDAYGQCDPVAAVLLDKFKGTYCEQSKSGDGAHVFGVGQTDLNGNVSIEIEKEQLGIEVYSKNRFICMTGVGIDTANGKGASND